MAISKGYNYKHEVDPLPETQTEMKEAEWKGKLFDVGYELLISNSFFIWRFVYIQHFFSVNAPTFSVD